MYEIEAPKIINNQKENNSNQVHSEKYENLINESLMKNFHNQSGCFGCTVDHTLNTPFDSRKIVLINCKGVLGLTHAILSDDIDYEIKVNDKIIISCTEGYDIAEILSVGDSVAIKRQKLGMYGEKLPMVLRKLGKKEFPKFIQNNEDELLAKTLFKEKVDVLKLEMKLVDVHYQFDRKKLYFFYTADFRVDFRQLAKELSYSFKTRIELRQIGPRDEAQRQGGVGVCGREYCCISFITDFKRHNLPTSNGKITRNNTQSMGACNRIKCCSSFD